ncbi:MAG TPA: hypothetical protein VJI66_02775 [Candidatus Paceibacterota bacterium]
MLKRTLIIILVLTIIGGIYYWFFYNQTPQIDTTTTSTSTPRGFSPFQRKPEPTPEITATTTIEEPEPIVENKPLELPKLRQLSATPISGMSASSTASSSVVRFIDRGTGHVYEASSITDEIKKISNTTLPRIYESYWNKNLNAFVLRFIKDETDTITNFYAEIRSNASTTETKGSYLSSTIREIAVSPTKDKVFTWNIESDRGIGYISSFDEKSKIKIVDSPLTQVTIDWPEINTATVATKASASSMGYMYSVNTKTGVMKAVLGGIRGLSAKMSKDLSRVIYSSSNLITYLLNTKNNSSEEIVFRTLADKCVWSNLRKNELYCAVPTEISRDFVYPDDWYKGKVFFVDKIWHIDTSTGEVHLLANLLNLSGALIDATNLTLDPKEDFLYFINKRDLTLWSLDLTQ